MRGRAGSAHVEYVPRPRQWVFEVAARCRGSLPMMAPFLAANNNQDGIQYTRRNLHSQLGTRLQERRARPCPATRLSVGRLPLRVRFPQH